MVFILQKCPYVIRTYTGVIARVVYIVREPSCLCIKVIKSASKCTRIDVILAVNQQGFYNVGAQAVFMG